MEYLVFAGNFEVVALRTIVEVNPLLAAVEADYSGIALELNTLVDSEIRQSLLTISIGKRKQSQTLAHLLLLTWMDAILQTGIKQYSHTAVADALLCLHLLFTKQGTVVFPFYQTIIVGCNLTIIERKNPLLPFLAPTVYQGLHLVGISSIAIAVILTLIPDNTLHGVTDERMEHTIIESRRTALLIFLHISLIPRCMKFRECLEPIALDEIAVDPCLTGTTAPGNNNQTYWYTQRLAQRLTIIISSSTKLTNACSISFLPVASHRINRMQLGIALNRKKAQLLVFTQHQFFRSARNRLCLKSLHRHLHVTLTRTDPDLTNQDIVKFQFLSIAQTQFIRTASLRRFYLHRPFSLRIGLSLIGLAVPGSTHFYYLVGISSTPEVAFRLLLQYHIVAKDLWQFHFCLRCQSHGKQQS